MSGFSHRVINHPKKDSRPPLKLRQGNRNGISNLNWQNTNLKQVPIRKFQIVVDEATSPFLNFKSDSESAGARNLAHYGTARDS